MAESMTPYPDYFLSRMKSEWWGRELGWYIDVVMNLWEANSEDQSTQQCQILRYQSRNPLPLSSDKNKPKILDWPLLGYCKVKYICGSLYVQYFYHDVLILSWTSERIYPAFPHSSRKPTDLASSRRKKLLLQKHTTVRILAWSPTAILTDQSGAWVRLIGREALYTILLSCCHKLH